MHSRYKPVTLSSTAGSSSQRSFLRKISSSPSGTNRMYMAVINPAFPADVPCSMPICCSALATASARPQKAPPSSSVFFCEAVICPKGTPSPVSGSPFPRLSRYRQNRNTTSAASAIRVPLNVKARTLPVAMSCATNPKPQTSAVSSSKKIDRGEFFFIVFRFLHPKSKKRPEPFQPRVLWQKPAPPPFPGNRCARFPRV